MLLLTCFARESGKMKKSHIQEPDPEFACRKWRVNRPIPLGVKLNNVVQCQSGLGQNWGLGQDRSVAFVTRTRKDTRGKGTADFTSLCQNDWWYNFEGEVAVPKVPPRDLSTRSIYSLYTCNFISPMKLNFRGGHSNYGVGVGFCLNLSYVMTIYSLNSMCRFQSNWLTFEGC